MKGLVLAAGLTAALLGGAPALAEPLAKGLKIKQVDRAFAAAAAAVGVAVTIGKPGCSPGEPGFFCSYSVGNGLRFTAGAPTLKSDIDSLEVESTSHEASEGLRTVLALTIAVLEPQMPPVRRTKLLQQLIDAIPSGETTVRGERIDFQFGSFGYGLVFTAHKHGS